MPCDKQTKPLDEIEENDLITLIQKRFERIPVILSFYRDVCRSGKMAKEDMKKLLELTRGLCMWCYQGVYDSSAWGSGDSVASSLRERDCGSGHTGQFVPFTLAEKDRIILRLYEDSSVLTSYARAYEAFFRTFDGSVNITQRLAWLNEHLIKEAYRIRQLCKRAMKQVLTKE